MNKILKMLKEKINEVNMVKVQKFRAIFTTVDGVTHNVVYKWAIADRLRYSVPTYIMISITGDKYIEDTDYTMYPLQNVISIKWELIDEKYVPDKFKEYQVYVSQDELEEVLS